eukprot:1449709-Pyramimonas_sp.AAC.1
MTSHPGTTGEAMPSQRATNVWLLVAASHAEADTRTLAKSTAASPRKLQTCSGSVDYSPTQ